MKKKKFDLKYKNDDFIFLPIGGAGEIGLNLNLYHYQGKWLVMDFGLGFASNDMPGIDMLLPDISFLKTIAKDIVAIVLTHAHEDHFGAIQYLIRDFNVPIYGTEFTLNFLRYKLEEYDLAKKVEMIPIDVTSKLDLEPFLLEAVGLNHSIPEMNGFIIHCAGKKIFHTGDWRFDNDPVLGHSADYVRLEQIGEEGIDVMICDSTNALSDGPDVTETDLFNSLYELVGQEKSLVVVTTFASNVSRIKTLYDIAKSFNRKVVVSGRSLWRIIQIARESGYFNDDHYFIEEKDFSKHSREKVLLLCTGCQGEERASMSKLIRGANRYIKLSKKDTVIFSSKVIPGNEKKIYELFNAVNKKGIKLITEKDHLVHISGHPYRNELKVMYQLIKPKIAIPVHGEQVHLSAHASLAKECGVKTSLVIEDGCLVLLSEDDKAKVIDQIEIDKIGLESKKYFLSSSSQQMIDRRKMEMAGIVIVTAILSENRELMIDPTIKIIGGADISPRSRFMKNLVNDVKATFNNLEKKKKKGFSFNFKRKKVDNEENKDPILNKIESSISSLVGKKYEKEVGKRILVQAKIHVVNMK